VVRPRAAGRLRRVRPAGPRRRPAGRPRRQRPADRPRLAHPHRDGHRRSARSGLRGRRPQRRTDPAAPGGRLPGGDGPARPGTRRRHHRSGLTAGMATTHTEHESELARVPAHRDAPLPVVDPATGEAFAEPPDQQPDALDALIDRSHRAWRDWRTDPAVRSTALRAAADAVETAGDDLARLLTREQGKPLTESHAEVARPAARLRYFAELAQLAPRTR